MKNFIWMLLVAVMLSTTMFAQAGSGVPVTDRDAFLQGQMDAQQATITGNTLASYCAGYASAVSVQSERALFQNRLGANIRIAFPAECQQFWTYADVYGPQFWYPRVYVGIHLTFGHTYGRWRHYDMRERPPYVGRPYPQTRGEGRQSQPQRRRR